MLEGRSEIAAVIARYVEELRQQGVEVERVYLFGSQLRGTAGELSDIDVVVSSPDFADIEPWERARILGKASLATFQATGESVEALAKTPEEVAARHPASFLADVLKDAELIYRRAPTAA